MHSALNILKKSISLLTANPRQTVQQFLPALGGMFIAQIIFLTIGKIGFIWPLVVFAVFIAGFTLVLSAVRWHRYALLADAKGAPAPAALSKTYMNYVLKVIVLVLALMLIAFVASFGTSFIVLFLSAFEPSGTVLTAFTRLFGVLFTMAISWIYLRLGLILPATALERPFRIGESWAATAPGSRTILWLAVILMGVNTVITQAMLVTSGMFPFWISVPFNTIFYVISTAVMLSLFSTLYGVYVEKRAL